MASVGSGAVETPDAAVEIARINADRDIALKRMEVASEASAVEVLAEATLDSNDTAEVIAEIDAEAEVQPEEIAAVVADAVANDDEPDVVIVGDGNDVEAGEMIEPLPDAIEEPTEDSEPSKDHWLTRSFS
jgi:hypothetical protein